MPIRYMSMGLRTQIQQGLDWLARLATHPRSEMTRWQRAARFAYDLSRYGTQQLQHDRAPQMAAAMAFRTLFGLLPVMVVATVVFKATQGVEGVQQLVRRIATALGLDELIITSGVGEGGEIRSESLAAWLEHRAGEAADINFAAIGWIGLLVMIYSAVGLMVTIEKSFNIIYRAPEGRPWSHRVPMYWTVLTLGTAAIAVTFYIDTRFAAFIKSIDAWGWMLQVATWLWSFFATWLLVFVVYKLVPNTRVAVRPALIGAFIAAILLEIGKRSLGAYFTNALSIRQLYGSLGLIPLFMFWVYVMWLVVMFGLEVASTLQTLHGRKPNELEQTAPWPGLTDPARIVSVMSHVAAGFTQGQPTSARSIAEFVRLPESTVSRMLDRLVEKGLVHRIEAPEASYTLARPPEQVSAETLLAVGFALADEGAEPATGTLLHRLRTAQLREAADTTLAGLLARGA